MKEKELEYGVSILCAVYNHEKYLRKCLDSFINQKTNFKYEAIIHDDCSTDNSKKIIEEYHEKYPDIIVPVYEEENQYSKGKRINIDILIPKIRGKYFALCEGDDYWINDNKLQKQYDFLENNPDYSFCVHNALIVNKEGKTINKIDTVNKSRNVSCDEFIIGGGEFVATNSIFARSYLTKNLPPYFNDFSIDYLWQIYLSSQEKTYCFDEYMSSYRIGVENSWTQRIKNDIDKSIKIINKINYKLDEFNKYTNYKYAKSVKKRILMNEIKYYDLIGKYDKLKEKKYKDIIKEYPIKIKTKYFIKIYMTFLYNKYRNRKGKIKK